MADADRRLSSVPDLESHLLNLTFFIHSNSVSYPPLIIGNTNVGSIDPNGTNSSTGTNTFSSTTGFYRVVRDGAHIYGLTNNSTLSDEVQLPIEIAVTSTDQIAGITFYNSADDSPVIGVSAYTNATGGWVFDWNTTLTENGAYSLYAEVDFASDDPVSSASIPVSLTVSNIISFPNYFTRVFGNQMWIYAETIPDDDYTLEIYDENTNFLGTFSDYSDDNGVISFIWDLTDGEGDTYDSTNFFGVFTVDTSGLSSVRPQPAVKAGRKIAFQTASLSKKTFSKRKTLGVHPNNTGSSSANQMWVKEGKWTPNNNWVVAYGLFSGSSTEVMYDTDMIVGGPGGTDGGVLGTLDQYGFHENVSPGNNAQNGNVFTLQDQASRTNLLNYLADHRYENFYFFGHGGPSTIGSYNGFNLTLDQIAYALVNVPLSYQIQHAAEHPYRFIFIDACDAGKANLCEAFGIPAFTVSTNYFATAGVESRAFVGFKSVKFNLNEFTWYNYTAMTGWFIADWLRGLSVQDCVNNAKSDAHITGTMMNSTAVIYGASDMNTGTHTGQ